jgi:hypothetical protein
MSADNGVYILYTESKKGPEYRVAYAQGIDNIYGLYNEETGTYSGNKDMILATFGDSEVFYSLDEAFDKADEISYDYEYLEYGTLLINEFREMTDIFPEK